MSPAAGESDAIKAARVLPSSGPPVCADAQVAAAAAAVSVKASGSAGYRTRVRIHVPATAPAASPQMKAASVEAKA